MENTGPCEEGEAENQPSKAGVSLTHPDQTVFLGSNVTFGCITLQREEGSSQTDAGRCVKVRGERMTLDPCRCAHSWEHRYFIDQLYHNMKLQFKITDGPVKHAWHSGKGFFPLK